MLVFVYMAKRIEKSSRGQGLKAVVANGLALMPKWLNIGAREVGGALSAYERGDFDLSYPLMERVWLNSPQVVICRKKRSSMVVGGGWDVVSEAGLVGDAVVEAERQADAVRWCLGGVRVGDERWRDSKLGFYSLVEMIMRGVGFGYIVASLDFMSSLTPSGVASYDLTVMNIPLNLTRVKDGRLVLISGDGGEAELPKGDWLVGRYDGALMPATLLLHSLKSPAELDWATACLRYGMPFVAAKTGAEYGSDAWLSACEAVGKIGSDFSAVFGSDVELQTLNLAQTNAPHERVVDYFDRAIARLWLGADLDTMSRGERSVGSDAQSGREDFLRSGDRAFVESVIDSQIVKPLLKKLGYSRQLVYFKFGLSEKRDIGRLREIVDVAGKTGIELPLNWLYEQLGVPRASQSEAVVRVMPNNPAFLESPLVSGNYSNSAKAESVPEKAKSSGGFDKMLRKAKSVQYGAIVGWLKRLGNAKNKDEQMAILEEMRLHFGDIGDSIVGSGEIAQVMSDKIDADLARKR